MVALNSPPSLVPDPDVPVPPEISNFSILVCPTKTKSPGNFAVK